MRARLFPLLASLSLACADPGSLPAPDNPGSGSAAVSTNTPHSAAPSASSAPASSAKPSEPEPNPARPKANAEEAGRFATSNNAFGVDLYKKISEKPGNLALSPTSLTIALSMAWAGAKGETASQMQTVMHLSGAQGQVLGDAGKMVSLLESPDRPLKLAIANRLFGEKTYAFEKPYLDATEKAFGAALEPVDFKAAAEQARGTINGWVEAKTEKRIVDLVPAGALDPDTRLVLVNAVYFLAEWQRPFEKAATYDAQFSVTKAEQKNVPTMHAKGSYGYGELDGVKLVELPYKGGSMSMLIALPAEVDGLAALEKGLSTNQLGAWSKAIAPKQLSLALPKFEVNPALSMSLGPALAKLGMTSAFDRKKADFTAMANPASKAEQLFISSVFHKAFVKVDEKGTEAAAATAVVMATKGAAPSPALELKADRPFLYFIRDNETGLVLFMGRVADPTAK